MTTTKATNIALVSLKLPKPVPALLTYAGGMVKAMTGNPSFANPTPTLAAITQAIADLQAAETTALARTKGAVSVRNEKAVALVALLKQLGRYIQAMADAGADSGGSIILSAGVAVRKTPTRAPRVFHAASGVVSGSAKLVAVSAGNRSSYEWQYSVDGGKTWVPAAVTLKANTTVAGLAPGATVQFRYRPVTKTGEGDWSQVVSFIVK
jgi:hypothetical protein